MHLIDGRDVLLPFLDGEVSRALAAAMERDGVVFHLKEEVQECRRAGARRDQAPLVFRG